jgi:hypothetical protein
LSKRKSCEEPAEVIEEVTAPAGTKYFDEILTPAPTTPVKTGRALNDATWAAREASMGGKYPYNVTKQPLIINLAQHPQNALLQPPVTAKNIELDLFGDAEELTITEVDASPEAYFFVQDDLVWDSLWREVISSCFLMKSIQSKLSGNEILITSLEL